MPTRRRVVFFAETVTLAHVARPITLATGLDPDRFDVTLAWHPRYRNLFPALPFAEREIRSIEPAQFLTTLASGRPSYDVDTLVSYVKADLAILDELRPDLVVGDFRLSLSVSARLRKIPYINITNAYWSPYADLDIPVPDVPPLRNLPPALAKALFGLIRPFAFARNAGPMRAAHRHFGVPPPPRDVRAAYTLADYVAYVDMPELVPVRNLPATHTFIGPLPWSPAVPYPDWWDTVSRLEAPKVYVTLGSSGAESILPHVLDALAKSPLIALVATAGRAGAVRASERVFVADYLPGDEAAALSSLVICNGGSPTSYQALSQGCPVLGICTNLDQQLNMAVLAAARLGKGMVASGSDPDSVRSLVEAIIDDKECRQRVQRLMVRMRDWANPCARFSEWISDLP